VTDRQITIPGSGGADHAGRGFGPVVLGADEMVLANSATDAVDP
jgi:hypothetical protein